MKNKFVSNAWAFKKANGKFLTVSETGYLCDALGTYEGNDPYLVTTRKNAREANRLMPENLKIVKVEVTIKEAA